MRGWLRAPTLKQVLERRERLNREAADHWDAEAVRFRDHAQRATLDAENAEKLGAMYRERVRLAELKRI